MHWLSLYAQLTPEALLFQALIIFILFTFYLACWVLKKRRFGSAPATLPAQAVQNYLNELIAKAQQLNLQLFGLDANLNQPQSTTQNAVLSQMTQKILLLETQLKEQTQTLQQLDAEKDQLEKKLKQKSIQADSLEQPHLSNEKIIELQNKLSDLEAQLAAYSLIEDDLANLKTLKSENLKLHSEIELLQQQKGIIPNTPSSPIAQPEATPTAQQIDEDAALIAEFERMLKE